MITIEFWSKQNNAHHGHVRRFLYSFSTPQSSDKRSVVREAKNAFCQWASVPHWREFADGYDIN